jgi:hypothetical protein
MALDKPDSHQHDSCGNCRKIKDAQCEEVRKALEECSRAREEAQAAAQESLEKELEEAKAKNKSLQKTVVAFQLATTVGVTLLGQEVFDKIMEKVNTVTEVQAKITGETAKPTEDKHETKGKTEGKKSVSFGYDSSSNIMTTNRFSSGMAQYIPRISITAEDPSSMPLELVVGTPSSSQTDILDGQGIGLPLVPPVITQQVTSSSIDWSKYIVANTTPPIEAVATTWGGNDWVDWGGGAATSMMMSADPVPAPNAFSVFALSLINSPRRRA